MNTADDTSPAYATTAATGPAGCWCQHCRDVYANTLEGIDRLAFRGSRMVVCPDCGNKRCPKTNFHGNTCTKSNELGQKGSSWESVKPRPRAESVAAAPLTGAAGEGERLSDTRLAELRAVVEAERTGWDGQPFDKLGFWPAAVDDLLTDLASARTRLQEETRAAAEARERAAELMAGLLMEWMDKTEPHSLTYDNPDEFLKDQGVHRKFFQLKAAACGLGWPLHEATIGISAALPLVGEEGKEGRSDG